MKIQTKSECAKDPHWNKMIQYQVIIEPTTGARLSFVPYNEKQPHQQPQAEKEEAKNSGCLAIPRGILACYVEDVKRLR